LISLKLIPYTLSEPSTCTTSCHEILSRTDCQSKNNKWKLVLLLTSAKKSYARKDDFVVPPEYRFTHTNAQPLGILRYAMLLTLLSFSATMEGWWEKYPPLACNIKPRSHVRWNEEFSQQFSFHSLSLSPTPTVTISIYYHRNHYECLGRFTYKRICAREREATEGKEMVKDLFYCHFIPNGNAQWQQRKKSSWVNYRRRMRIYEASTVVFWLPLLYFICLMLAEIWFHSFN
jgi:hypothetical protein